jgi:endonuclease/exonuclease/phosphatase family metal-dependent hydrolase
MHHSSDYQTKTILRFVTGIDEILRQPILSEIEVAMGVNLHVTVNIIIKRHIEQQEITLTRTPMGGLYITSNIAKQDSNTSITQKDQIRIMSYNIQHFYRGWDLRIQMLRDFIQKFSPDIIGFQEIRLDEDQTQYSSSLDSDDFPLVGRHQLHHLKEALRGLGYKYYTYQPAMSYIHAHDLYRFSYHEEFQPIRSEEGVAIFSKYPIIDHSYILLSRNISDSSSHQRICLHAKIKVGEKTIDFYDTHLSLRDHPRQINMGEILSLANASNADLRVLVGDYNSEPHEWTVKMLDENEWIDTHRVYCHEHFGSSACYGDQPANTFSTDGHFNKRIDYIYVKGANIEVQNFEVIGGAPHHIRVVDDMGRHHPIFASDHYGIIADIKIP